MSDGERQPWVQPGPDAVEAIRAYIRGSRGRAVNVPSPLFTGRDEIIDIIVEDARELRKSGGPLPNLSTVLYGGPGAGKSECLLHLIERLDAEGASPFGPNHASQFTVIHGDRHMLEKPVDLAAAVHAAHQAPSSKMGLRELNVAINIGLMTASTAWAREQVAMLGPRKGPLLAVREACGNPTVVLLVDEAQNELDGLAKADLPNAMHKLGFSLKVLPVYAGLGNTVQLLSDAGVSRLATSHTHLMKRLEKADAHDLCKTALFSLATPPDRATLDRWADAAVARAQGWPMHLNHVFLAVARRAGPDALSLDDREFASALAETAQFRSAYYDKRLDACPSLQPERYEMWASLFEGDSRATAKMIADAFDLPGEDPMDLVDRALRAGLVEKSEGFYVSPIPSLAAHIERRGRENDELNRRHQSRRGHSEKGLAQ